MMELTTQKAQSETLELYRRFFEKSAQSTPFHSPEWLECCLRLVPRSELEFLVLGDSDEILGMMPYVVKKMGPVTSTFSLPYGTYGGFLFTGKGDLSGFAGKIAELLSPKGGMTEIVDYHAGLPALPGFEMEERMCHVLDLRAGYDNIWENRYDRIQRKTQRSARNKGVMAMEIRTQEDLHAFYQLYSATYAAKGSNVFSLDELKFLFDKLKAPGIFRGLLAVFEGVPIAGTISLFHPNVTVGFLQGSSKEHRSLGAVNLLIDEAIKDAIALGSKVYNLGVTPRGAQGVIRFKESFGAVRKDFPVYVKRELVFKIKAKLKG